MKTPVPFGLGLALLATLHPFLSTALAQGTGFTYQGRLAVDGNTTSGVYDFTFTLFGASNGGSAITGPVTNSAVGVTDGLFTTTLDLGANFPGADRWLEMGVRSNGVGVFVTLSPRQQLTPTPYAITAGDATSGNIARLNVPNTAVTATGHPSVTGGFITSATVDNPGSGYASAPPVTVNANGPGSGAVITATISGGSVTALNVMNAGSGYTGSPTLTIGAPPPNNHQVFVTSNYFPNVNVFSSPNNVFTGDGSGLNGVWKSGGNSGTTPGPHFLGTTDDQPLELKVNNARALRLEPTANNVLYSNIVNVIAGSPANTVGAGVLGATISGGGAADFFGSSASNRVDADFGSVGGGQRNIVQTVASSSTIGGGNANTIQAGAGLSTIDGGRLNTIQTNATAATIGGGFANTIQNVASFSTIGGGEANTIQPAFSHSTIGGGNNNTISGHFGTVPGGDNNVAGTNSFAAGHRAKANHIGAFVWADSTDADFASTANNQFSIRAAGGVRLSDNTPNLSFGSTTRQMVNLFGASYGLGVQESTLYQRSNFRFSWFVGGSHNGNENNPGGGTVAMTLTTGGLTVNGTFVSSSDRNVKERFEPVNSREVLEQVAALPLARWSYKEDPGTRHLGAMAQDFYAAFQVGPDDKHIATVDADGVALAAIQGLNQKLEEKLQQKQTEITELKQRLEKLEILLNRKLNGGVK